MVTQKSIFEKIGGLLQDLAEQYEFLQENPKEQQGVHLELFEANMTYLMGHVTILKKLTSLDSADSYAKRTEETMGHEAGKEETVNASITAANEEEETVSADEGEKENSVLNYVDQQEIKETYFTPATASEEEKAEEFRLEDKRDEKEEQRQEQTESGEHIDYPLNEDKERKEEETELSNDEKNEEEADEVGSSVVEDEKEEKVEIDRTGVGFTEEEQERKEEADTEHVTKEESEEPISKQVIEEEKSVVIPVEQEKPAPTPDEPKEPKRPMTLNELFSAQRKQEQGLFQEQQKANVAAGFVKQEPANTAKRITDIKSAVSLNDKLLFIKDLFNGYSLAYTEAIELLSRYDNFADADAFLQSNYAQKNNWANKQATVDKLYAILRQRFS